MERLGLLGVHWRTGTEVLERFTLPREARSELLPRLADETGVSEMLYLATCNRVEILFARPSERSGPDLRAPFFQALRGREPEPGEAERTFRAWGGEGAAEHLLLVAAGLDSAQLGEHEIRGQLRESHAEAQELGLTGPRLDFLIETAMRVARDVQQRTGLSEGRISIAEVGLDAIRERLRRRGGEAPLPVALLGVSAMTERSAEELVADGVPVIFVNRTPENAEAVAERFGAVVRRLDVFRRHPEAVEAIVSATGASEPVLDAEALRRMKKASPRSPLVLDFGIPADVDAEAARAAGLPYLGMDALNRRAERHRARRQSEAAHARRLVDEALGQLRHRMAQHTLGPVLSELGRRYRETADTGLDKLFRRQLRHLEEGEREAVRRYAHNLAKRLAHVPIAGLRALAGEHGSAPLETFLAAADPLLHEQLEAARERDDLFRVAPEEPE